MRTERARRLFHRLSAEIDPLPAARVAVGLAVPGFVLIGLGRTDLLIYAAFGSFTGMYGFSESPRQRLGHQLEAGVILCSGVGLGVLLARVHAPPWLLVASVAIFAGVWSPATDRFGLRPEGPFFGMFAFGAVAMVAGVQADPVVAFVVCAVTAALSVCLGFADAMRPTPGGSADGASPTVPVRRTGAVSMVQAARYVLAISLSGGLGTLLGVGHANWAMAGAAVPLAAANARGRIQRGLHRVVGTFIGLAVTAPFLLSGSSVTVLAVATIMLLYPTELFMAHHYAIGVGFFTPLIMSMTQLAAPTDPLRMLTDRAVDTLIGVAVGLAVAVLVHEPGAEDEPVSGDGQQEIQSTG